MKQLRAIRGVNCMVVEAQCALEQKCFYCGCKTIKKGIYRCTPCNAAVQTEKARLAKLGRRFDNNDVALLRSYILAGGRP